MAHPRKLLRCAAVALLVNANTAACSRVFENRVDPLRKLPAIGVYILGEEVDLDASENTAPRELERRANMEIVGFVSAADETALANAMDDIAEQIERAMDADPYINGKAGDSILKSTEIEVREGDGQSDPLVGLIALTYAVTYRTSPAAPDDLDDFVTVDAKHQVVGGVEDTAPAEDTFAVQEVIGGDEYEET